MIEILNFIIGIGLLIMYGICLWHIKALITITDNHEDILYILRDDINELKQKVDPGHIFCNSADDDYCPNYNSSNLGFKQKKVVKKNE